MKKSRKERKNRKNKRAKKAKKKKVTLAAKITQEMTRVYRDADIYYYIESILYELDTFEVKHPNRERWLRDKVFRLLSQRLSTGKVELLEELYSECDDDFTRKLLARKSYTLRHDYLMSHKEFSDRRLIMFAERETFAEKWEGIYLLGAFGKDKAHQYLAEKIETESNATLRHAMQAAMNKIKRNAEKKKKERGF